MKYNLATDLISTELRPWINEYKPRDPETEFWPPALWSDVAQTRAEYNGEITDPSAQKDIKYIYSRKFRPYALFTQHWNTLFPKMLWGRNGYAIEANFDVGIITEMTAVYTDVSSLEVTNRAVINSVDVTSITATKVSSQIGIINHLVGKSDGNKIHFDDGEFRDISTVDVGATGIAQLTAYRAYWADVAEYYRTDELYEPGTLIEFSGPDEISLATSNVNGCISKSPAFRLNYGIKNDKSLPIVLVGKTKVKVIGAINKFDRLELSNTPGIAKVHSDKKVIGIALEDNSDENVKLVESIVKLSL